MRHMNTRKAHRKAEGTVECHDFQLGQVTSAKQLTTLQYRIPCCRIKVRLDARAGHIEHRVEEPAPERRAARLALGRRALLPPQPADRLRAPEEAPYSSGKKNAGVRCFSPPSAVDPSSPEEKPACKVGVRLLWRELV